MFLALFIGGGMGAAACDICGCGVGSYYNGILPDFKKKIMGFRYRSNQVKTHLGTNGEESYLTTLETYRTVELWGGWNLAKRWRIMASLPYSFNTRSNPLTNKQGIGDMTAACYYRLFSSNHALGTYGPLLQSLWAGGGAKLPTGEYDPKEKTSPSQNSNLFQLGTGSMDYMANLMYDIRLRDVGLNVNTSYKMNGTNKSSYSYGNKLTITCQAYWKWRPVPLLSIAPNAGVVYEKSKTDISGGFPVDISGGKLLLGSVGTETSIGRMSIGGNFQWPLSQNLANGFIKSQDKLMVHVSLSL